MNASSDEMHGFGGGRSEHGRADDVRWRELLAETADVVGDRSAARWLCEVASGADVDEFLAELDQRPTQRMVAHLDAMVARYRAGEPLQYVLGRWGFRRLDLAVEPSVLIPRSETELLVEIAVAAAAPLAERRVLDLGTGSGAIGLALADELPLDGTEVWLTDVSERALAIARANLAGLGRAGRNVRIAAGDWYAALPGNSVFDVIVSNPPYVATDDPDLAPDVAEWEPGQALFAGADGLDALRVVVAGAPQYLAPGGLLAVEHGHRQGEAVQRLFDNAGFLEIETTADLAGHDRVTAGRRSSVEAHRDFGEQ